MSASHFGHFLGEPRALGGKIDHALQRQRRDLAAHDELHGALRRGICGEGNVGDAREPLHEFRPAAARARVSLEAPASTSGNCVAGGMLISDRTERIAVTRSITQPISASAAASSSPSCCGQACERQHVVALRCPAPR